MLGGKALLGCRRGEFSVGWFEDRTYSADGSCSVACVEVRKSICSVVSTRLVLSLRSWRSSSSMKSSGRAACFFARSEREDTNVEGVHPAFVRKRGG